VSAGVEVPLMVAGDLEALRIASARALGWTFRCAEPGGLGRGLRTGDCATRADMVRTSVVVSGVNRCCSYRGGEARLSAEQRVRSRERKE
jgi:hypothetical protein